MSALKVGALFAGYGGIELAIGISRNDQLKALGNGVVPQQCAAALRAFLTDTAQERAS